MTESIEIIDNIEEQIIENKIIKKKGQILNPHKVKRAPERWLADGKYNDKPLDADYFKKYWRIHSQVPIICPICDSHLKCRDKIKRHETTKKCLAAKNKLESKEILES